MVEELATLATLTHVDTGWLRCIGGIDGTQACHVLLIIQLLHLHAGVATREVLLTEGALAALSHEITLADARIRLRWIIIVPSSIIIALALIVTRLRQRVHIGITLEA